LSIVLNGGLFCCAEIWIAGVAVTEIVVAISVLAIPGAVLAVAIHGYSCLVSVLVVYLPIFKTFFKRPIIPNMIPNIEFNVIWALLFNKKTAFSGGANV
jgi:hypothetical protein